MLFGEQTQRSGHHAYIYKRMGDQKKEKKL
jgi:hypothetical protein